MLHPHLEYLSKCHTYAHLHRIPIKVLTLFDLIKNEGDKLNSSCRVVP